MDTYAVWMWALIASGDKDGLVREDSTSIEYDEPFIIKYKHLARK